MSWVSKYRYDFSLGLLQLVPWQHSAAPGVVSSLVVNRLGW